MRLADRRLEAQRGVVAPAFGGVIERVAAARTAAARGDPEAFAAARTEIVAAVAALRTGAGSAGS